ncbi:phosphoethanolamine transferase [Dysgonomonas alginatilytica]|nr:phosphoethanolamine transferase [Dysgonomonas alginatilytica]
MAYGTRIMFGGVASMFETNRTEAMGMAGHLLLYGVPVFLSCVVCLYCMTRELKKSRLKVSVFVALALICAIVLPIALVMKDVQRSDHRKNTFREYPLFVIQEVIGYRYPIGYGSLLITAAYLEETRKMNQFADKERVLPEGVEFKGLEGMPQTVYVLVGESSLRTHYSLYGYDIPTTPFLDSMYREQQLYKEDAVSPASLTRDAIKMTLSFATPNNQNLFYENNNAVELANLAGYSTYWISNQDKLGVYDSNIGLIASSANHIEFHNYKKDDLELINIVDSLYNKEKHQVFFIHLKGSHLPYPDKSDERDDVLAKSFPEDRKGFLSYDKTIHHTDRVVKSLYDNIVSRKDSTSSLVYYYSDHGEIIETGHGFLNHGIEQFLIPFIAIPHNFQFSWQDMINRYLNNGEFNSVNFINIFAQSIGYSLSDEFADRAKSDGPYYYHVDRKVYNFNDIKK